MAKSSIKLEFSGFERLLDDIKRAEGDVKSATEKAIKASADIVESELKSACNSSGAGSVVEGIRTDVEWEGNRCTAKVGWEMGEYNPKNPSIGYKAVFLNYGTARRQVKTDHVHVNIGGGWHTLGTNRGKIAPKNFISTAKKASAKRTRTVQRKALQEILKGLKG